MFPCLRLGFDLVTIRFVYLTPVIRLPMTVTIIGVAILSVIVVARLSCFCPESTRSCGNRRPI
jgi:hypothetical protein